MSKRKKSRHGCALRRRYGRSAIPMKVHGQLFMEPESVLQAVEEARAEICEAEVPAQIALESMPPTLSSWPPSSDELAPTMRAEELAALGHSWAGEQARHSKAARKGHRLFRKAYGADYGRGGISKR